MKVLLLAAGRGERMRDLTLEKPKPLLYVRGKSLIEHQIERLVYYGYYDFVINVSYMANDIIAHLGYGEKWGCNIVYSHESRSPLETGGGIIQALPLLSDPFLVVNADIWTNYDFSQLKSFDLSEVLGCLVLVKNPSHNLGGDYSSGHHGRLSVSDRKDFTFSGISCLKKELFNKFEIGRFIKLSSIFECGIKKNQLVATLFNGYWVDVGTPERLLEIQNTNFSK